MRHLVTSLYYWLAASGDVSSSSGAVLSCSDTSITLAGSSSVRAGEIFINLEQDQLCQESRVGEKGHHCSVLFREIIGEDIEGVFPTRPATFAQVFPPETFDISLADVAVESILPPCSSSAPDETKQGYSSESSSGADVKAAVQRNRKLQEATWATPPAPAATPAQAPDLQAEANEQLSIARKYEDDDYYDDDYYDDEYYDDKYVAESEPGKGRQFLNAIKELVFDIYCIIRNLECTEYNPGQQDETTHEEEEDNGKDKRGLRFLLKEEEMSFRKPEGGVRGLQASTVTINTPSGGSTVVTSGGSGSGSGSSSSATTATTGSGGNRVSGGNRGDGKDKEDNKGSGNEVVPDNHDDTVDDDFFDDDKVPTNDGGNFAKLVDALFDFGYKSWCIFFGCKEDSPNTQGGNPRPDDDKYYDKDKDKDKKGDRKERSRSLFAAPTVSDSLMTIIGNVWENAFAVPEGDMPATPEDWAVVDSNGSCRYTKCDSLEEPDQCFEIPFLVGQICRENLDKWFALPIKQGEDQILAWKLDAACKVQDYCYASNTYNQHTCDEHFYQILLQSCPVTETFTISGSSALTTNDLYEHCPLVSLLLYAQAQQRMPDVYRSTRQQQKSYEANKCLLN